jgi:hypothetical protein
MPNYSQELLDKLQKTEDAFGERSSKVPSGAYMVTFSRENSQIKEVNGYPMLQLVGIIDEGEQEGRYLRGSAFWFAAEVSKTSKKSQAERQETTRNISGHFLTDLAWAALGSPSGGEQITTGLLAYIEALNDVPSDVVESFEAITELLDGVSIPVKAVEDKRGYVNMRTFFDEDDPTETYNMGAEAAGVDVDLGEF